MHSSKTRPSNWGPHSVDTAEGWVVCDRDSLTIYTAKSDQKVKLSWDQLVTIMGVIDEATKRISGDLQGSCICRCDVG